MIIDCPKASCKEKWDIKNAPPKCGNKPCPIAEKRTILQGRQRGVQPKPANLRVFSPIQKTRTEGSLAELRKKTKTKKPFVSYTMDGAQSATSKAVLKDGTEKIFKTTGNMHSEIKTIEWMLANKKWKLENGRLLWQNGTAIGGDSFSTTEPHCGYCTILLEVLELPHTKPTTGNYNLANNLAYPLPKTIKEDANVMARLLGGGNHLAFSQIKKALNNIINLQEENWVLSVHNQIYYNDEHPVTVTEGMMTLTWDDVVKTKNGELLTELWKFIFQCIYDNKNKPVT